MSNTFLNLVYARKIGSATKKSVLIFLADKADDNGGNIWPAKQTIADVCELSKRAVQKAIAELIGDGVLIETGQRKLKTGGHTTIYAIVRDVLEAMPPSRSEQVKTGHDDAEQGEPDAPGGVNVVHPVGVNEVHRVNLVHGGGEPDAPGGVNVVHPNHPNNHLRTIQRASRERVREADPPELNLVADDGEAIPDLAEVIVEDWNRTCEVIASEHLGKPTPTPVTKITPARRERIAALLPVIGGQPEWRDAFNRLRRDPWWRGSERRVKPLTFDELTTARNGRDAPIIEISELDNAPRDAIDAAVANGHFSQREAAFQRELARLDGDEPARRGELETVDECGF